MNKYKRLASDTIVFAIGKLGSKLILFLLLPLYTNCLSTSEYGTVELVDTFVNLILPVASMVIFEAVHRFTLDKNVDNSAVILNAALVFVGGSLFSLLMLPLLGLYEGIAPWRYFVSVYVIAYMASTISLSYIKSKGMSRLYAVLGVAQTALTALLNIALLLGLKAGVYGYLLASISSHIAVFLIVLFAGGILKDLTKARFDKRLLKEMLAYSAPLILNNLSWWGLQSANKMLVGLFLSSAALGIYSVASKIPSLINVFITIFGSAWSISATQEYDSDRDEGFFARIFSLYSFAVFFFCACLLVVIKPFMGIYVGDEFYEAWRYVPFLLVSACFSALSSYFGSLYGVLKRTVNNALSTLVSAVVSVGLNILLLPRIGVQGAAIATLMAYVVIALYRLFDTRRYLKFPIRFGVLTAEALAVILASVCVINDWGGWIAALAAGLIFVLNLENVKLLWVQALDLLKGLLKKRT